MCNESGREHVTMPAFRSVSFRPQMSFGRLAAINPLNEVAKLILHLTQMRTSLNRQLIAILNQRQHANHHRASAGAICRTCADATNGCLLSGQTMNADRLLKCRGVVLSSVLLFGSVAAHEARLSLPQIR